MTAHRPVANQVLTEADVLHLQAKAEDVFVHDAVLDYAVRLVLATREPAQHGLPELEGIIAHGASPRATLALLAGSRALALMRGLSYAVPRDVFDVARDVLRHRVLLSFDAIADDVGPESVVERIVSTVLAPRVTPSQDTPSIDDQSTWAA